MGATSVLFWGCCRVEVQNTVKKALSHFWVIVLDHFLGGRIESMSGPMPSQ